MKSPLTNRFKKLAFTLIELLVVIAIIAILIGLLFPVFGAVMEKAKKAHASSDEQQIVAAVKAYYTEYGTYPIDPATSGTGPAFYGASKPGSLTGTAAPANPNTTNNYLFDVLRNNTASSLTIASGSLVPKLNPRQIAYMEIPAVHSITTPVSGVMPAGSGTTPGAFYDPWGSPYNVYIDGAYGNQLKNPYTDTQNTGGTTLNTGVIVWALGKNGQFGGDGATLPSGFNSEGGTANNYKGSGDVISWQ